MIHPTIRRNRLLGAVLGAIALLASTAFAPATASAADYSLNMGSFGQAGKPWDASTVVLNGEFWRPFERESVKHYLWGKRPDRTTWETSFYSAPKGSGNTAATFSDAYSFSLKTAASMAFSLRLWENSTRDFTDGLLSVKLEGPNGFLRTSDVSTAERFSTLWANLEAGNYVLRISGAYTPEINPERGKFHIGYVSGMTFSEPLGDVPLPGALVLLGTALAGAGITARRTAKAAKAEA
ncbi:hypothetical protein IHV25_04480 [Phaeovibrio sulfidiphilus]|uniref:PEP-CTERM protein-sorting domain-containing protein n=1 Tax=Phaeovibrio sulfidiphilus TaxID=1220600 RepID=A0A8J7CPD1_9PROT|nr:hypothetical protein [Phaeovibrio sulfidiphilus]MBE1236902.1 hypothetical protein [Phaeovibrio sulfidiphilus]